MAALPGRIVARLGITRASKIAGVGALTAVLLIIGLAAFTATRTESGIEDARSAAGKTLVAVELHGQVAAAQSALDDLRAAPSARARARFERASTRAARSLGDALPDLVESATLQARLVRTGQQFREAGLAVARSDSPAEAERVYGRRFVPRAGALHALLDEAERAAVGPVDGRLRAIEKENETLMAAMPVAFGAGVLVLALMWAVGLEGRRREAATEIELSLLEGQARTDSMTGAGNHRAFQEDLERELGGAGHSARPASLVLFDVVGLKHVNDTLGHQVGDDRLKLLARCLRELAPEERIYRTAGDEFAVVLAETGAWEAFDFAQSVHHRLRSCSGPDVVRVAAGVADRSAGVGRDALVRRADLALIAAKASRRDTMLYSPDQEPSRDPGSSEVDERHAQTIATALARAVDAKDSYTRSHSETVSVLCVMIAEELGLAPERIAALRLAGLLHDVGKIGIGDDILQKPASLTGEEFEVMKSHVTIGHRIVMGAALEQQAGWILRHHERPDGRGYPDGLVGEEIPLESRIILVCDAFEAIIADRPYRRGRPVREALAELERHSGTQFDPDCVRALHRALARGDADGSAAGRSGRLPPVAQPVAP